jgi:hypothetical protein
LCWSFIWLLIVHPTPEDHPTISEEEKEYILKETGKNKTTVSGIHPGSKWVLL